MRAGTMLVLALLLAVTAVLAWAMVDVREVERGRMPDVGVEAGRLPAYDRGVGEVDVRGRPELVEVPRVTPEPREVEVPAIDVERPDDRPDPAEAP